MTMICAHARWDNQHAFGQSRISLDTGSTVQHSSSGVSLIVKPSPHIVLSFILARQGDYVFIKSALGSIWAITVVVVSSLKQTFL